MKPRLQHFYGVIIPGLPKPWDSIVGNTLFVIVGLAILYLIYYLLSILTLTPFVKPLRELRKSLNGSIKWLLLPWRFEGVYNGKQFCLWFRSNALGEVSWADVKINYDLSGAYAGEVTIQRKDDFHRFIKWPEISEKEYKGMMNDPEKLLSLSLEGLAKSNAKQVPPDNKYAVKSKELNRDKTLLQDIEVQEILDQLFFVFGFDKIIITIKRIQFYKTIDISSTTFPSTFSTSIVHETLQRLYAFANKMS